MTIKTTNETLPLPLQLDEITADWLSRALGQRYPGTTVERVETVELIRGTCTKIRLRLELNETGRNAQIPEHVVLKSGFEPHSRDFYITMEKEVRAYRDTMPHLPLRTPGCYFAGLDEERLQGVVIMDDLVERGVNFCHPLKPQSFDDVARRLTELAAFHAASWNSDRLEPGGEWDWLEYMPTSIGLYMQRFMGTEKLQNFIASPQGAAVSTKFHDEGWIAQSLENIVTASRGQPQCVLHGDTHLGNLYVDTDGTPGFYDPQTLRGPALLEVAYHVSCALDLASRKNWERELIAHYLAELSRHGVAPMTLDEAMHLYGIYLFHGYCIFLVNESYFQSEAINTAYTARIGSAMLDNNTFEALNDYS